MPDEWVNRSMIRISRVAGRVPVIVTCSHFYTEIAAERAKRAAEAGAAGAAGETGRDTGAGGRD